MLSHLFFLLAKYPLVTLGHLMLLLPVVVGIYRREYLNKTLVGVIVYFILHFIEQSWSLYYVVYSIKTVSIQKGFLIIYVLIVGEIFYLAYKGSPKLQRISVVVASSIFIALFVDYFYNSFSFIGATLFRVLLIVFSLTYFNKILSENRVMRTVNHPMFWIGSGFLMYGMGTFMTSLFIDYLLDTNKTSEQTYDLFLTADEILGIIQCLLAAIGLWVSKYDKDNYMPYRIDGN